MSPFYTAVELNTRERVSLAPGSYGTSTQPGLKIVAYIEKASKPDKTGAMRHSFLVSATRPSREQIQQKSQAGSNGDAEHPFEPDYDGTAFLAVSIHEDWKHPACLAIAFTEATRNKEGKIQHDYVADAVKAGEFTAELAEQGRSHFRKLATDKVIASNTPAEKMEEAVEAQYRKELMQISIKVGELFTLQDWAGWERDPGMEPSNLVGTEFSGKIETSGIGQGQSEVARVYSKKK